MGEFSFLQFYGEMKVFREKLMNTKVVEHKISHKMVYLKLDFRLYKHSTLQLFEFIQQKTPENRNEICKITLKLILMF